MAGRAPCALRQCLRQNYSQYRSIRSFSSSEQRLKNGALATFPSTSSPELDNLLSNLRRTIFLPAHLTRTHTDMIYRKSLQHFLTGEDPVSVEIPCVDPNEPTKIKPESFILEPLDQLKEPSNQRIFYDFLQLLNEKQDWAIVPEFLREIHATKRKVSQTVVSKLLRRAADAGQMGLMLELFRRTATTGLKIDSPETARELMLCCLQRATKSEWAERETEKALKHAKTALLLMQEPSQVDNPAKSLALEPQIVGIALALAAIRAVKFKNGADEDGKVKLYAERFLEQLPRAGLGKLASKGLKPENWWVCNNFLTTWVPSWIGVRLALDVLKEGENYQQLNDVHDSQLEPLVLEAKEAVEGVSKPDEGERRGLSIYADLARVLENV